jgi:hypothetical protein
MSYTPPSNGTANRLNRITPTQGNSFEALASDSSTSTTSATAPGTPSATASELIFDDVSLSFGEPGEPNLPIDNLSVITAIATATSSDSSDSDSSMTSTQETAHALTKETLQDLMERLDPGCTNMKTKYAYTDVIRFQTAMGDALAGLIDPLFYNIHGYSFLADTDADHLTRSGKAAPVMPTMPNDPDDDDLNYKIKNRRIKKERKHFMTCHNIKTIGISLLEQRFPECLRLMRTNRGLHPETTLKSALAHVLEGTLSPTTKLTEFMKYTDEFSSLSYTHVPETPSLVVFLGELERIRDLQLIVATTPSAAISFDNMILRAHHKIYEGTGGRRDRVQELLAKWREQIGCNATDTATATHWQNFKAYYRNTIMELDREGLTTAKTNRARANSAVISPQQAAINQDNAECIEEMQKDISTIAQAMSAFTVTPPARQDNHHCSIPPVIQAPIGSNASALTTDQSFRLLMEERNRSDKEKMALQRKISDLEQSIATGTTQGTSTNNRDRGPEEGIMQQDSKGHKWYKVVHYCSKHGFNGSHSNGNCRDKAKTYGQPWVEGATSGDQRGGSSKNVDKFGQWFNPRTKQYAPTLP